MFRRGRLVARGRTVRHCIAVLAPVRIGCLAVPLRLLRQGSEVVTVRMDAGPRAVWIAVWIRGPVAAIIKAGVGLFGIESPLAVGRRGTLRTGPADHPVILTRGREIGCSGWGPPATGGF